MFSFGWAVLVYSFCFVFFLAFMWKTVLKKPAELKMFCGNSVCLPRELGLVNSGNS